MRFIYLSALSIYYWHKKLPAAYKLRLFLEQAGPLFIKLGQLLSTRLDLLPLTYITELSKLQDKVKPYPTEQALAIIDEQLNKPHQSVFATIEQTPIAAASLAQVYKATLISGEVVAVKVLRPKISKIINSDLRILNLIAYIATLLPLLKRLKLKQLVAQLAHSIRQELDFTMEAANASQLKHNCANSSYFYVPKIYWQFCKKQLLVSEYINGVALNDLATLKACNTNMAFIADRLVAAFAQQAFRDYFFHADLHPGNILIDSTTPNYPKIIAVDFGIMGNISANDSRYIAANFAALFARDYQQVAKLHFYAGWLPKDCDLEQFACQLRHICEPVFAASIQEVSLAHTILQLIALSNKFKLNIQPQLLLLQKTLINLEGVVRLIAPELNLITLLKPYIEQWLRQALKPSTLWREFVCRLPYLIEHWLTPNPDKNSK